MSHKPSFSSELTRRNVYKGARDALRKMECLESIIGLVKLRVLS
jgi:hypothetical protein